MSILSEVLENRNRRSSKGKGKGTLRQRLSSALNLAAASASKVASQKITEAWLANRGDLVCTRVQDMQMKRQRATENFLYFQNSDFPIEYRAGGMRRGVQEGIAPVRVWGWILRWLSSCWAVGPQRRWAVARLTRAEPTSDDEWWRSQLLEPKRRSPGGDKWSSICYSCFVLVFNDKICHLW